MKLKRTTMLLVLAAAVGCFGTTAFAQKGKVTNAARLPRIEVPETSFNFGRVAQGASISHRFVLRNVGQDTLFIQDVKPG